MNDRPVAHEGSHPAPPTPVGFLELFFDLVFVATTMVLSNEISHDLGWYVAAVCGVMYLLAWLVWFHTTVLMNIDRTDDAWKRALVFSEMFVLLLAVLIFAGKSAATHREVAIVYVVAVLIVAIAHQRSARLPDPTGEWIRVRRNRLFLAAGIMVFATVLPQRGWIFYTLAVLVMMLPTGVNRSGTVPIVDAHHLTERAALLTLIMFGETFVKLSLVVSEGAITSDDVVAMIVLFVVLFSLFTVYFDDVPKAGIRPGSIFGELWLLAHFVLQFGLVAMAVGMSKYLLVGDIEVHREAVIVLAIATAALYLGLALVGAMSQRRPWKPLFVLRIATAAIGFGVGVISWHDELFDRRGYAAFVAVLAVVHAVIAYVLRQRTEVTQHIEFDPAFEIDSDVTATTHDGTSVEGGAS